MKVNTLNNKYLIWGAIAIGAYLVWKKMKNTNPYNSEVNQTDIPNTQIGKPQVSPNPNHPISKPPINTVPSQGKSVKGLNNRYLPNGCPTKETFRSTRFGKAQMDKYRAMGCI